MELVRYWRMNAQRYSLQGSVCTSCGKSHVSQRPVCDVCGATTQEGHVDAQVVSQVVMPAQQVAAK